MIALAGPASAGDADDQRVVKVQRMLRQMSLERDAIQAENAKLKAEIEALNGKLGNLKRSSETALSKSRDSLSGMNEKLQQLTQDVNRLEAEKKHLQETVAGQGESIVSCEGKNAKLAQLNLELLTSYERKGFLDAILQREPLTQLKRVEMENMVQEYQGRIEQQEIKKSTGGDNSPR
jgi:predicted RNase H-like nuclease (RuvC/YqgF family)